MSKLVKNSLFYTIGNILPQAAGFILLPIYTSYLDPEQYGIVNSMTVLGSVIGIMLTFGIDRSIYRLYYDYENEERRVYLGTLIIGLTACSVCFFIIALLVPQLLSSIYKSIPFYPFYVLMLLSTLFSKAITIPSIYLRVSEQAGKFVLLNIGTFALTVALNLLFIIHYNEGAVGMLKGTLFASMIIGPIFYLFTYKAIKFKFNINYFKESIIFSLPLLPAMISAWVLNLSDRIFLERYLSLNEVGIYSLAYKIASLVTVISGGLFTAYAPHFYTLANKGGIEAKGKIEKYNNTVILIMMVICFFVAFFSKEMIELFISKNYSAAVSIIPILIIGIYFSQITGFLNLMIYQEKKTLQIMYIALVSALINVISNLILIPIFGMVGSAFATLISFLLLFIIVYWYAKKCYFIPFHWPLIMTLLIFFIIIYASMQLLPFQNIFMSLVLKTLIAICIALYFLFKYKKQFKLIFGN